ncbi:hypothetical protein PM082_017647 [Marasmius tenuissimus]|nr:hypothetical protein PM082_017647 [Marasmius tenuissimus]
MAFTMSRVKARSTTSPAVSSGQAIHMRINSNIVHDRDQGPSSSSNPVPDIRHNLSNDGKCSTQDQRSSELSWLARKRTKTFTSSLPDRQLLSLHAVCAQVANMSSTSYCFDERDNNAGGKVCP